MKLLLSSLFSLFIFCLHAQIQKPIGVNLNGITDYSTEFVFTDAMKQSRSWISANSDGSGPWDTQISIPLNSQGYPLEIPYDDGTNPPQKVKTLMLWDIDTAVPTGAYRLIAEGTGEIHLDFGASGTFTSPVDTLVQVNGGVMLEITDSDVTDPIHNIQFIYPHYINNYQNQTFNDELINFLDDFQVIRFMDWLRTNNSSVANWSDRGKYDYYTQAQDEGISWEYIIELANLTQKDIWINIPHLADDTYISNLASLLKNDLNSDNKIYIEYSNEVWNSIFTQHHEAADLAQQMYGYTGQEWERAWKYTARRSSDIFYAFDSIFTDTTRLVKVIPSQAANSWLTNELLTFFNDVNYNPHLVSADAVAIAPYFGGEVGNQIVDDGEVSTITIPEIIQRMDNSRPQTLQWMLDNKTVADNHNLDLICYEGGQHLVATGNNVNNDDLTDKLIATNHAAGLESVYCDYFDDWYSNTGGLFVHFSSHSTYSKWGSWGVKENYQDINNPKYLALQNCVFNDNSTVGLTKNYEHVSQRIKIYPNPSRKQVNFINKNDEEQFKVYDTYGQLILTSRQQQFSVEEFSKGVYFIHLNEQVLKVVIE